MVRIGKAKLTTQANIRVGHPKISPEWISRIHIRLILNPMGAERVLHTFNTPPVYGSNQTRLRPTGVRSSGNLILTSTGSP